MKQQWYVEEQVAPVRSISLTTPVATQPTPTGSSSLLSSMTEAELEAIAEEAGVTVDFVRQSLAQSDAATQAQMQQPSTATKASVRSDYYQVSLRVRKPTQLSKRRVIKAVALPAVSGLTLGTLFGLGLVGAIPGGVSNQSVNAILWGFFPLVSLLLGIGFRGKRLGTIAGSTFAGVTLLTYAAVICRYTHSSLWDIFISNVLPACIVYMAIGGALGLSGALLRTRVSRVQRRRRERLQSRIP